MEENPEEHIQAIVQCIVRQTVDDKILSTIVVTIFDQQINRRQRNNKRKLTLLKFLVAIGNSSFWSFQRKALFSDFVGFFVGRFSSLRSSWDSARWPTNQWLLLGATWRIEARHKSTTTLTKQAPNDSNHSWDGTTNGALLVFSSQSS